MPEIVKQNDDFQQDRHNELSSAEPIGDLAAPRHESPLLRVARSAAATNPGLGLCVFGCKRLADYVFLKRAICDECCWLIAEAGGF